jgi:ADP-dependent NAD(P)H-hydrate dehydratase / NAD(P)H-hydrate epimerase
MFEVLTADEMKKADAATIAAGTPGLRLMEQAGAAVARIIENRMPPCPVLVLCGAGNNGGDGFITAARLKKAGWPVRLACLAKKTALKGDAALAAAQWDGEIESLNSNVKLKDAGLVIDAIFGTGFTRGLDPEIVTLFDKIRARKISVVAVDVPSGIDATTGAIAPGALQAEATVTFCRKKIAHMLLPSKAWCGRVHVAMIGISDETVAGLGTSVFENDPALWIKDFPIPRAETHKYDRGHALVYGGEKRTGAACLAAAAAQKMGAGLVTIASRPASAAIYKGYRASLMVDEWQSPEDLGAILRDERKNALLLGPGAGTEGLKETVETILSFNRTAVLDADVFTAFKDSPKELFAKLSPDKHVLTPHEGEFVRLFGTLEGDKAERARKAAKAANAIIILKGSDTVIAAPDGTTIINTNAPPTLAIAGTGDVLSGFITGLAAQGMPVFMAAAAGVWLHAETALHLGLGLVAEDIISHVPQILNRLFRAPGRDS